MEKISVGILGATGMVGQWFMKLLADHPWFEITALAASARSAGKTYAEATTWVLPGEPPEAVQGMVVDTCDPHLPCRLVFSALPAEEAGPIEEAFAAAGYIVSSNAKSHRYDPDVPLLIPEVNPDHLGLIEVQKRRRRWQGFIVTCANCSTAQLVLALEPLRRAFGLRAISVVTMQALSGAGYPGVPGLSILDNVIPYIPGEEEKVEREPKKIWGCSKERRSRRRGWRSAPTATGWPPATGTWKPSRWRLRGRQRGRRSSRPWRTSGPSPRTSGSPAPRPGRSWCGKNPTAPSRGSTARREGG